MIIIDEDNFYDNNLNLDTMICVKMAVQKRLSLTDCKVKKNSVVDTTLREHKHSQGHA